MTLEIARRHISAAKNGGVFLLVGQDKVNRVRFAYIKQQGEFNFTIKRRGEVVKSINTTSTRRATNLLREMTY